MATHPLTVNCSFTSSFTISANVFEPLTSQFQFPFPYGQGLKLKDSLFPTISTFSSFCPYISLKKFSTQKVENSPTKASTPYQRDIIKSLIKKKRELIRLKYALADFVKDYGVNLGFHLFQNIT